MSKTWIKGTKRCKYCGHYFQSHIVDLWVETKGEARCSECDGKYQSISETPATEAGGIKLRDKIIENLWDFCCPGLEMADADNIAYVEEADSILSIIKANIDQFAREAGYVKLREGEHISGVGSINVRESVIGTDLQGNPLIKQVGGK